MPPQESDRERFTREMNEDLIKDALNPGYFYTSDKGETVYLVQDPGQFGAVTYIKSDGTIGKRIQTEFKLFFAPTRAADVSWAKQSLLLNLARGYAEMKGDLKCSLN